MGLKATEGGQCMMLKKKNFFMILIHEACGRNCIQNLSSMVAMSKILYMDNTYNCLTLEKVETVT